MSPGRSGERSFQVDLSGRTALVSGGTSGIGLAIAHGLHAAGADVLIHGGEPQAEVDRVASSIVAGEVAASGESGAAAGRQVEGASIDLAARDGGEALAQWALSRRPAVDLLFLCAAVQFRRDWTDIDDAQFDAQIDVNLRATLKLLQALVPPMARRGFGRVVTIGSVQQTRPHAQMLIYAATKSALRSIVRNLARQLGPHGVTINNIAPGVIATPRNADWLGDAGRWAEMEARVPARRIGAAEDCVGVALLMCSPAGAYLNGADVYVDGGFDAA